MLDSNLDKERKMYEKVDENIDQAAIDSKIDDFSQIMAEKFAQIVNNAKEVSKIADESEADIIKRLQLLDEENRQEEERLSQVKMFAQDVTKQIELKVQQLHLDEE